MLVARKGVLALALFVPMALFGCGLVEAETKGIGAELDSCVSGSMNEGVFSGSVLVAINGRVVLSKGYGWADRKKGIRNTPQTRFQIGSVTKQFTAAAVMRLRKDGKLREDDRVSAIIPGYPGGTRIALWQLMTHSSGIPEYLRLPGAWLGTSKATTPDALIDSFKHYPLEFEPGSRFAYSNSGYLLLGAIIEKRSGMAYGKYLDKAFLTPLGMGDTSYDPDDAVRGNDAIGYRRSTGGSIQEDDRIHPSVAYAAGGIRSSVEDMYVWDRALAKGSILGRDGTGSMMEPRVDNYGYGWFIEKRMGRKCIWHGGSIPGFLAFFARFPERDATVIVLSNLMGGNAFDLGWKLSDIVLKTK